MFWYNEIIHIKIHTFYKLNILICSIQFISIKQCTAKGIKSKELHLIKSGLSFNYVQFTFYSNIKI